MIYPVFVTDADDDACQSIPSLPQQSRHGVKELITFLAPYVNGEGCLPLKSKYNAFNVQCELFFCFPASKSLNSLIYLYLKVQFLKGLSFHSNFLNRNQFRILKDWNVLLCVNVCFNYVSIRCHRVWHTHQDQQGQSWQRCRQCKRSCYQSYQGAS